MKGENAKIIVFGKGVFEVDGVAIGLTRDGGKFSVEREMRVINADGDRGNVKGRIVMEGSTAKLEINHLELLTNIEHMHTALSVTTAEGKTVIKGTGKIDDEKDYHEVVFKGATKDGRNVKITVKNAINLENIEWELKEKDDIVDKVTYTSSYDPQADDELDENWEVEYITAK